MPCLLDMSIEQRLLIYEVLLFAEKADHTAISIFKWTYQSTLGMHFADIKFTLSEDMFQTSLAAIWKCHLWNVPQCSATGFNWGMIVSYCTCCFPSSDLFILEALSASGPKDAWADGWSKIKRAMQFGWAFSKTSIACLTWASSCSVSHYASPLELHRIDNFSSLIHNVSLSIMKYQMTCDQVNELWDMKDRKSVV